MRAILIFSLIFSIFSLSGCKTNQATKAAITIYQPTRTVTLSKRLGKIKMTDLFYRPITMHDFGGKPVFLNFWATWCGPCISEMRSMAEVYEQFKDEMVFVAVSTEDLNTIREFKEKHQWPFDFARLDIDYTDAYVVKLPTTMLIDRDGKLVHEEEGIRVWTLYNNLEKLKALVK